LEKSGAEKTDLTSKIEELNLYNDSSEKELRKIIRNKQVGLVTASSDIIQVTEGNGYRYI
jgi:hypothetical protein